LEEPVGGDPDVGRAREGGEALVEEAVDAKADGAQREEAEDAAAGDEALEQQEDQAHADEEGAKEGIAYDALHGRSLTRCAA
jgi:hypothetical protein